jgi:hypothetical protein
LSIYAMAVWCITSSLGLNNSFPWPTGPLSNWMVWLGLALAANLGAFLRRSDIQEKTTASLPPVLLEELTVAEWSLEAEEERTPGQLVRGKR